MCLSSGVDFGQVQVTRPFAPLHGLVERAAALFVRAIVHREQNGLF